MTIAFAPSFFSVYISLSFSISSIFEVSIIFVSTLNSPAAFSTPFLKFEYKSSSEFFNIIEI